jgi:hypothetical protein
MVKTWKVVPLAALLAILALPAASFGQAPAAVARAQRFLGSAQTGREVLGYAHFGSANKGHSYLARGGVTDRFGRAVPGHFYLSYVYRWGNDRGETVLAFLCNADGYVYEVQVVRTNAILNQPFALANVSNKLIGGLLLGAFGADLTPAEKRDIQRAIDNADAKDLLQRNLALRQRLGR